MKFTWRTEWPLWLLLAAMFVAAAACWRHAPEQMPVHWDIHGNVDRYGGRFEGLLLLPLVSVGIYLLLTFLPRIDPRSENYRKFATAYKVIRFSVLALMGAVYAMMLLVSFGYHVDFATVVPLMMGVLFVVIGNVMSKLRPNWFAGVRTPWTLSSRLSWDKTHRLAGWLFIVMGLLFVPLAIVRETWLLIAILVFDGACIVWMIAYSYFVWRDDPDRDPMGRHSASAK